MLRFECGEGVISSPTENTPDIICQPYQMSILGLEEEEEEEEEKGKRNALSRSLGQPP